MDGLTEARNRTACGVVRQTFRVVLLKLFAEKRPSPVRFRRHSGKCAASKIGDEFEHAFWLLATGHVAAAGERK